MKAVLISIGDEILTGFIVNTNAAFLAKELTGAGITVPAIDVIADEADAIVDALKRYRNRCDWVIVTGGLGPTSDDITKDVVAGFFDTHLVRNEAVLQAVKDRFAIIGRPVTAVNEAQADVPETAEVLPNHHGTAPGMLLTSGRTHYVFLPGVPHEMKALFTDAVLPRMLRELEGRERVAYRVLRTVDIGESALFERVSDFENRFPDCSIAFLPQNTGVQMRVGARATEAEVAERRLNDAEAFLKERAGVHYIGGDEDSLEKLVGEILTRRGETLSVAESCTGGLISHLLTNVPGSSDYFVSGQVTYANEAKSRWLGVDPSLIDAHGAVSEAVAEAMARGVREKNGTDWGLSVTGIAGPGGGTDAKPVGLVYIGCASANSCRVIKKRFFIQREINKNRFARAALNCLREELGKC